jgi:hypothetical protein
VNLSTARGMERRGAVEAVGRAGPAPEVATGSFLADKCENGGTSGIRQGAQHEIERGNHVPTQDVVGGVD